MITTNLPTLKINKLTQAQYDRVLAAGNVHEDELYMTPASDTGTGGLLPQLHVSTPTGTVITAMRNGQTFTATAVDNLAIIEVPEYGDYTISGTVSGVSLSKVVTVDKVMQIKCTIYPSFLDSTWDLIISACQNDIVPDEWLVGDTKAMVVGDTEYEIRIIGKYHDSYSDGSGIAPLTFQFASSCGTYAINTTSSSTVTWSTCAMHTSTLPSIKASMPTNVQSAIKSVTKRWYNDSISSYPSVSSELFLLSLTEGGFSTIYGGTPYEYYAAGNLPVSSSWTNTKYKTSGAFWCMVTLDTDSETGEQYQRLGYTDMTNKEPTLPAFCF